MLALLLAPGGAEANTRAERQQRLSSIETFAFALGGGASTGDLRRRFADYDLVVVEPDETSGARVKQLRAHGKIVLAYLSVGTIEKGRFWYRSVRKYRLKDKFDEFDEYYARPNRAGYRRIMLRVARRYLRRKQVDGLFLDNTDFTEVHPRQKRGLRRTASARSGHCCAPTTAGTGRTSAGPTTSTRSATSRCRRPTGWPRRARCAGSRPPGC
jgi:hypothetical protein